MPSGSPTNAIHMPGTLVPAISMYLGCRSTDTPAAWRRSERQRLVGKAETCSNSRPVLGEPEQVARHHKIVGLLDHSEAQSRIPSGGLSDVATCDAHVVHLR